VIERLIEKSQFGFIKGRNIKEALRTILDIMEDTDKKQMKGMLIAIDFEKAFDSLSWKYLFKTLEIYNFGREFQNWIKLLYTDISSCVINEGYTTPYFELQRGVRQGDSLSPYLFILALELCTLKIRNEKEIKGLVFNGHEIKLVNYADDTTAIMKDEESASRLFRTMKSFEKLSGLKINMEKTEGMWLGPLKHSNKKILGIKWKQCLKLLGIHITYNEEERNNLNYQSKIPIIQNIFDQWKQRNLTIYGKILLIKTFALSQIIYTASVIPVPDKILLEIEKMIYGFLWKGKQHKVKKAVIIQDYKEGGNCMINLKDFITTQNLTWIKNYLGGNRSIWKYTMESIFEMDRLEVFLQSNFEIPYQISEFYKTILKSWLEVKQNKVETGNEIIEQYIWHNKYLKFQVTDRIQRIYMEKGILKIKDIIDRNCKFKTIEEINREYQVDKSTFMTYQSIIHSIPPLWKQAMKNKDDNNKKEDTNISINENNYNIEKIKLKEIYKELVYKRLDRTKAYEIYTERYNIKDEEWESYFTVFHKLDIPNKAKEIQYKILQNYVATNKLLYKMKIKPNPRCNFCNLYSQDTEHLFFECLIIKDFWMQLNKKIQEDGSTGISINIKDILFGEDIMVEWKKKIVIMAKWYIFQCKYAERIPCCEKFMEWVKKYLDIKDIYGGI
jgi:hypothetical protein